eukprot:scaffold6997_cov54-Phaeocystis_antarctica.AAC.2
MFRPRNGLVFHIGKLLCALLPLLGRAAEQVDHQRVNAAPLLQARNWTRRAGRRLRPNGLCGVRGTQAALLLCPKLLLEDLVDAIGTCGCRAKASFRIVVAGEHVCVLQPLLVRVPAVFAVRVAIVEAPSKRLLEAAARALLERG